MPDNYARFVVYYDREYFSSWVSQQNSLAMTEFLQKNGFTVMNADTLSKWMDNCLKSNSSYGSVVVLSQDAVPYTICHEPSTNAQVRFYLDSGGKIVWVGDAPFWYQAKGERKEKEKWEVKGATETIGVITLFATPRKTNSITRQGKEYGLSVSWSGTRPIVRDQGIIPLALSDDLAAFNVVRFEPPKTRRQKLAEKFRAPKKIGIELSPTAFGFELESWEKKTELPPVVEVNRTHVSGWLKTFNSAYPGAGFFRIWDFSPRLFTKDMLGDLLRISSSPTEK